MQTDHQIIAHVIAAKDTKAFGELIRRHQSSVRRAMLRLTKGNTAEADDLSQIAFMRAHAKLPQYNGQDQFKAWVVAIGYREFLSMRRTEKRRQDILDRSDKASANIPAPGLQSIDIDRALDALNFQQRAALSLFYREEFTHDEIAKILDMPVGTVKSHIARGKKALRAFLADYETETDYATT